MSGKKLAQERLLLHRIIGTKERIRWIIRHPIEEQIFLLYITRRIDRLAISSVHTQELLISHDLLRAPDSTAMLTAITAVGWPPVYHELHKKIPVDIWIKPGRRQDLFP